MNTNTPDEREAVEAAFAKVKERNIFAVFAVNNCFFDHEAIWKSGWNAAKEHYTPVRDIADDDAGRLREIINNIQALSVRFFRGMLKYEAVAVRDGWILCNAGKYQIIDTVFPELADVFDYVTNGEKEQKR